MKTLEEISDEFALDVEIGSSVRLVLIKGLDVRYDKERKTIHITPAKKLEIGMPNQQLVGVLKEYSDWGGSGDPALEFETDDGYAFTLDCSQIENYEVLESGD